MKPNLSPTSRLSLLSVFAGWPVACATTALLFAATLLGQQTTAPASATGAGNTEKETPVVLSPFEVSTDRDIGYTAANALAGSRTNTPLKNTPAAISVMTSEFLDDVAGTTFRGVQEWVLNTVPAYDVTMNNGGFGGHPINFRNMGQSFSSRNYFIWYFESDVYNVERFEMARGPNGVLFGDGGSGGIATTWSKRAKFQKAQYAATARADSYGSWRTTLDLNRPVHDRLALRLNTLFERGKSWRDYVHDYKEGVALAGTYRLTDRSQFRFEGEFLHNERSVTTNYYFDRASFWDGVTSYNGATAPSTAGTGVARIANTPTFVYVPGTPNGGFNDWSTFYWTNGAAAGLRPTVATRPDLAKFPILPKKSFNLQPPDSVADLRAYTYTVYLDHRFGDNFYVEAGYNRTRTNRTTAESEALFQDYRIDVNRVLPGGAPNPNYGKPFSDAKRTHRVGGNTVDDARVLANWRHEHRWFKESVSFIGGTRMDRYDFFMANLVRTNGASPDVTAAANQYLERRYWDQTGVDFGAIPAIPGVTLDYVATTVQHERKALDYAQIASATQFFGDRLTVMLGARRDHLYDTQRYTGGVPRVPGTNRVQEGALVVPDNGGPAVGVVGAKSVTEVTPTSYNYGAVYYVLPWLGVFANYSETFNPPTSGNNRIDGSPLGISRSSGNDYGIKLNLLDGKVSGSLSYYSSEQADQIINGPNTVEMNRLWTNVGRSDLANIAYRDTQALRARGYEIDITANPTRQLRLMFNLALPKAENVNLNPGLIAYFNAHVAEWQAAANNPSNPTRVQIQSDIDAIRSTISALTPGTLLNNTYKYTSNLYATYTVGDGPLKNLSIGGGANFRGKSKIASVNGSPYSYLYADSYYVVSANAAYRYRFSKKLAARFQLNVNNLLDNDKEIAMNYVNYRSGGINTNPQIQTPNRLRLAAPPRQFILSTTFEF